jgi:hypothetical protein
MENLNEQVFNLHDEGVSAGKIAQKLRIKKAVVLDILGDAADKGLGSKIEKLTEATGIKAVVEAVTDDCGCKARAEKLNDLFPNRKLNDLLDEQYEWLDQYFSTRHSYVNRPTQVKLVEIYNHVFNSKRVVSSCGVCVKKMVEELQRIYERARD